MVYSLNAVQLPLTAQIGFDWQELYVPLQTSYTAKSHTESMTTAVLFVSCYIPLQEAEPRTRLDFFFVTQNISLSSP